MIREDRWEIGWPEISKETQKVKMGARDMEVKMAGSRVADSRRSYKELRGVKGS